VITVRDEQGLEVLDAGASAAFAVADHQIAHVYVNDRSRLDEVRRLLEGLPGVEQVLGAAEQADVHINHTRAGDLVVVANADAWFTYYYWLDDKKAPDFARTVDIHRKPGYDPVELFLDPAIRIPPVTVGWKLFKRKLGFRGLLDVIPLDATLVRGSHGRSGDWDDHGPLVMSRHADLFESDRMRSVDVFGLLMRHLRQ